jgi:uncharacterized protein DUF6046
MPIIFFDGRPKQDSNMYYNGKTLPRDAVAPQQQTIDFTNNPSLVTIGNGENALSLPSDVMVMIEGEKIIAESVILDGVSVFEHIARKPYQVDFDCNIWDTDANGKDIFPQDLLDDIFTNVFLPNTVISVTNTYLNKLGIRELIIKSISPATVRGSFKIPLRIRCYENVPGQSIIM